MEPKKDFNKSMEKNPKQAWNCMNFIEKITSVTDSKASIEGFLRISLDQSVAYLEISVGIWYMNQLNLICIWISPEFDTFSIE